MLKWLALKSAPRDVRADELAEEDWSRSDQSSLFLLVRHHNMGGEKLSDSIGISTFNSLIKAGFAEGWALPLRAGPRRHHLLDGATQSEFISLRKTMSTRRLAEVEVEETHAWDLHYRSDIYATGTRFELSFQAKAMELLTEKVRSGAFSWIGGSTLYAFAIRVPVAREFAFPDPRATEKPYSDGPAPSPLRRVARFRADWIEVAALDTKRMHDESPADESPLSEWFADGGPVRLSFG
ncbi:MAG TPA: hypothetical protein VNS53_04525 [Sphingomicrobium sp.]|nr:hypothetical protein [Sphingomicrobium sp.]